MQRWNNIDMSIWKDDWINKPAKNGESFFQMYQLVSSFLDELKQKNNIENVLIFSHGGVIACAKVYFGRATMEKAFENLTKYGEVIRFEL